jgi:hypothetical protein
MSANLTVYCLQQVTDYFQFERLCHDLMALQGFSTIEPLGGFKDKGRDALHTNRASGTRTVFGYSVREDWRVKIAEDAEKIRKHEHPCDHLVYITTAEFSAGERDEAVRHIRDEYGWELDLYGVERLRVLLDGEASSIKHRHPQVFPPEILAVQANADFRRSRRHLLISYAPEQFALAQWLTRRLTAEGYAVWCERGTLTEEPYPTDLEEAVRHRVAHVVGLFSDAWVRDPEASRLRLLAATVNPERQGGLLIPLKAANFDMSALDRATASLRFIDFDKNWAEGLRQLLQELERDRCPKAELDGKRIASEAFLAKDLLVDAEETLVSNCLEVLQIPDEIRVYRSAVAMEWQEAKENESCWAFRRLDSHKFLSFCSPPAFLAERYQFALDTCVERDAPLVEEVRTVDVVSELIRKSLLVFASDKNLVRCSETGWFYFPKGLTEGDRLKFSRPDGSRSHIISSGKRKYWRPTGSEDYCYYLGMVFWVSRILFGEFTVLLKIRVHMTDIDGRVLPLRKAISRRKHLCGTWWSKEWADRLLAICEFLGDDEDRISIGEGAGRLVVNAKPLSVQATRRIDENALDALSFERTERMRLLAPDSEEDCDDTDSEEDRE